MGLTTNPASLQLHSSTLSGATVGGLKQIKDANQILTNEMNSVFGNIDSAIAQGLGFATGGAGSQEAFNTVFQNSQDALDQNQVNPSNLDFSNYNPYMQVGSNAANELDAMRNLSSEELYNRYLNNPAVRAQIEQGNRQINANAATTGTVGSGAVLRALQSYGQGIAAQGFGQTQENLYKLASLGSQAANQYASSILNKYNIDQQTGLGVAQNRTALINAQRGILDTRTQGEGNQLSFLNSLTQARASAASNAALQRQSSLVGAAHKFQDVYGMGYGGTRSTVNTQYNF